MVMNTDCSWTNRWYSQLILIMFLFIDQHWNFSPSLCLDLMNHRCLTGWATYFFGVDSFCSSKSCFFFAAQPLGFKCAEVVHCDNTQCLSTVGSCSLVFEAAKMQASLVKCYPSRVFLCKNTAAAVWFWQGTILPSWSAPLVLLKAKRTRRLLWWERDARHLVSRRIVSQINLPMKLFLRPAKSVDPRLPLSNLYGSVSPCKCLKDRKKDAQPAMSQTEAWSSFCSLAVTILFVHA